MREKRYSSELNEKLAKFLHGNVLDQAVLTFEPSLNVDDVAMLSKQAVLAGMQIFQERHEKRFYWLNRDRSQINIANYFNVQITGEPRGELISLDMFLGPCYDFSTKRLVATPLTRQSKIEIMQWCESHGLEDSRVGYSYAYVDPPYGLKVKGDECNLLFNQFLEMLFYNFEHDSVIYSWSDDWSNYFDAGKEWWGTFCWSVLIKEKSEVVVVAASTSD